MTLKFLENVSKKYQLYKCPQACLPNKKFYPTVLHLQTLNEKKNGSGTRTIERNYRTNKVS